MNTLLRATNITKIYDDSGNEPALNRVSLTLNKSEFVAIMGPSGSGKSTLLYNISGMDTVSEGSVKLAGQELSTLSEKELSTIRLNNMGFVFQHMHFLKNLSIIDNIILPAYFAKKESRHTINERAKSLMKKTGIKDLLNKNITEVSGGQLQRAAICRALINQPDIIFGDEPTGALHSKAAKNIIEILADINETGTAILIVTHDLKVAARTERVLYMLDGKIIGECSLGQLKKNEKLIKEREEKLAHWLQTMGF